MGLAVKPTRREMLALFMQTVTDRYNDRISQLVDQRTKVSGEISKISSESREVINKFIEAKYKKTLAKATAALRKDFPNIAIRIHCDTDIVAKSRSGAITEVNVWLHTHFEKMMAVELDEKTIGTLSEHNTKRKELAELSSQLVAEENRLRSNRPNYDSCLMQAMTKLGEEAKEHLEALSDMLSEILDKELLPDAPTGSQNG